MIPSPDPAPAAAAMRQALADAQIDREQVDHVNAHATSTPVGDAAEAAVLRLVLGDDADRIPVSSTKSLTGHMLTAAGAFEALACLTALRHQAIPPTINLDDPDVDLCLVANEARPHRVRDRRLELVWIWRQQHQPGPAGRLKHAIEQGRIETARIICNRDGRAP